MMTDVLLSLSNLKFKWEKEQAYLFDHNNTYQHTEAYFKVDKIIFKYLLDDDDWSFMATFVHMVG